MEIPIGGTKEKKRRFFRKTGSGSGSAGSSSSTSSRGGGGQNSWESQQSPTTQSAGPSLTNSFENTSITAGGGVSVGLMNNLNFPGSTTPPSAAIIGGGGSNQQQRGKSHLPPEHPQKKAHRHSPGNSMSLDEAEHLMMQHRRVMAAPRRARSAERFEGMRINNSPGEKLVHYPLPTREELLDRNKFNSPRPIRPTTAGGAGGTNLVNDPHRRNPPLSSISGITSPPPPYQAAMNEKTGPPSYRQALAAAAAANYNQKGGGTHPRQFPLAHHHHLSHHHRGAQSLDSEFGSSGTTMRSAVSVPAFSNDVICSCSKCQIQNKSMMADGYGSVGDYNDSAVYMESQAFLMHEIMTDGMAFCSIM